MDFSLTTPEWTTLNDLGLICFGGDDAASFLQGQLSNDVTALKSGDAQWTSYNTPKGRVIALGLLSRHDESFYWSLPQSLIDTVAQQIKKFTLRSAVTIEATTPYLPTLGLIWPLDDDAWRAQWPSHWPSPEPLRADLIEGKALMRSYLLPPGSSVQQRLQVTEIQALNSKSEFLSAETQKQDLAAMSPSWLSKSPEQFRLLSNILGHIPWLQPVTSAQFTAHMLSLDKLGAISFTKGCYVGQEVIARTEHLGKVKRRLAHVIDKTESPLAPMAEIKDAQDHKLGNVLFTVTASDHRHCQAVMRAS